VSCDCITLATAVAETNLSPRRPSEVLGQRIREVGGRGSGKEAYTVRIINIICQQEYFVALSVLVSVMSSEYMKMMMMILTVIIIFIMSM
jgi:hypothetical protein